MALTLSELLTQMRDFYLRRFREVLKEQRQEPGVRVIAESVLRKADGEIAREGLLGLPMRVDAAVIRDGKVEDSFQIVTERTASFKPFTFRWTGGAEITVGPFQWEDCRIKLIGAGPESNFQPLASWFTAWFDESARKGIFYSDLQGVLHGLTGPQFEDVSATFSIDFGSALPDVFEYLLDALEQTGTKTIQIGLIEEEGQAAK
jgi:hypothetical protein